MTDRTPRHFNDSDELTSDVNNQSVRTDALWSETDILVIGLAGQLIERRDPANSSSPVTDAINDLDSAGGGEIRLPPRTIDDTGPLPVSQNVHVKGVGHGGTNASIVNITGGGKGIYHPSGDGTVRHGSLEGFQVRNGDGLGGQSNGDSIAMHLEDTIRGFDIDLRFDDWASEALRSDAPCFENRFKRIYANACDANGADALFHFANIGPSNVFGQVTGYPTDGVSASDSTVMKLNSNQETTLHSMNIGGTADWALWNNGAVGQFGPINYEPQGENSNADRVIHHAGGRANYAQVTVQGATVNNVIHLNGGGADLPIVSVDNATINGNRVYVNLDITQETEYQGKSATVNNDSGVNLSQPVNCKGDGVFKVSAGTGNDGGTDDIIYGPGN